MNIFKYLDLEYRKSCLLLSRVEVGTNNYYVCKNRVEILSNVLGVLKSYSWVKRNEVKKKIQFFMENNFDYSYLAKEFGISDKSAYVLISRAGKQFKEYIGVNDVDELLNSNLDIENIKIKYGGVVNIFISDIREQLVVRENDDIDLLECMLELKTLKNLTKTSIQNRVKNLDADKVSHILYVLETNKVKYTLDKEMIDSYLRNDIKSIGELELRFRELYNIN